MGVFIKAGQSPILSEVYSVHFGNPKRKLEREDSKAIIFYRNSRAIIPYYFFPSCVC